MKILKNIKDLFKEDEESNLYSRIFLFLICYAFLIALIFRILPYGEQLEIKDYFNFAGSFGGAIIGGFISLVILKITLKEQKEQFEKQKEIEDIRREEDRKQFEKQLEHEKEKFNKEYNIKIINDKIMQYKELYFLCEDILMLINKMTMSSEKYNEEIFNYKEYNDFLEFISLKLVDIRSFIIKFKLYVFLLDEYNEESKKIEKYCYDLENSFKTLKEIDEYNEKLKLCIGLMSTIYGEIDNYLEYIIKKSSEINSKKNL